MNVVDTSGWLEYFANHKNASYFAEPIEQSNELVVPTSTIVEVFKKFLREKDEPLALKVVAHMKRGHVVNPDSDLSMDAAKLGHELKLPLADSIILATTRSYNAILWTQDEDFKGLPGVRYISKRS